MKAFIKTKGYFPLLLFMGHFMMTPQQGWGQDPTWGNITPPSSTSSLLDLGSMGSIVKAVWSGNGSDTLAGTSQILHMAELDFNQSSDYELKIAYVYQDPFHLNQQVDPARCIEVCYYIPCVDPSSSECKDGYQRFCEPVQGGQFGFVSHIASKYGAVMATNGAFYDYFYQCVPGVKSYIRIDGHVHSSPNILNHRNEGALAFDFSGSSPLIDIFKRTATTLQELDDGTIYPSEINNYPNVMSGGHLYENGKPYHFVLPAFCNNITYPWTNDPNVKDNILDTRGAIWRNFACPTLPSPVPGSTPYDVALHPTGYGYHNFFQCADLGNLEKRQQFTCIDYEKYTQEFGGTSGLSKRSRTFIGLKNGKFYWFVADGCKTLIKDEKSYCRGFTIDELNNFAARMGLEKLLNFDGGSSSAFYVNGQGILQFQYDPNVSASILRVGPQGQRLLQSVLMLVPKQKPLNQIYGSSVRSDYAFIPNNSGATKTSFIDLSSALPQINDTLPGGRARVNNIYGKFRLLGSGKGQILLAMVKDQNKAFRQGWVVGAGPVPGKLLDILTNPNDKTNDSILTIKKHPNLTSKVYNSFKSQMKSDQLNYWAFKVVDGKLVAFDIYSSTSGSISKNQWHTFMLTGFGSGNKLFKLYVDNSYGGNLQAQIRTSNITDTLSLTVMGATHCTIGSMVLNGTYVSSPNIVLQVQDFVFSYSAPQQEYNFLKTQDWTSSLSDPMHTAAKAGTNGSTIFCFDENSDSKMVYAWYNEEGRQLKAYGTYVNEAKAISDPLPLLNSYGSGTSIAEGSYYIVRSDKCIAYRDGKLTWNIYKDSSGETNHEKLCDQVEALIVNPNTSSEPQRIQFKLKSSDMYLSIDANSIPIVENMIESYPNPHDFDVPNYNLKLSNNTSVLTLYHLFSQKTEDSVAFEQEDLVSFKYQLTPVSSTKSSVAKVVVPVVLSVALTGIIAGAVYKKFLSNSARDLTSPVSADGNNTEMNGLNGPDGPEASAENTPLLQGCKKND